MSPRILGLDCGGTTGWHLLGLRGGSIKLGSGTYQDQAEARNAFANWLTHMLVIQPVALVAIERPALRGKFVSHFALSLTHVAHDVACRAGARRVEHGADTVRKWLIGRARRSKDEGEKDFDACIRAAAKVHGCQVESEHQADAAAVALYARYVEQQARAAA